MSHAAPNIKRIQVVQQFGGWVTAVVLLLRQKGMERGYEKLQSTGIRRVTLSRKQVSRGFVHVSSRALELTPPTTVSYILHAAAVVLGGMMKPVRRGGELRQCTPEVEVVEVGKAQRATTNRQLQRFLWTTGSLVCERVIRAS